MKKLNILTIAILASFSLNAQDTTNAESEENKKIFEEFQQIKDVFSDDKEKVEKIDQKAKMSVVNEGKLRSKLRQEQALADLENAYLSSDIERLNQRLEQRRLKYLLSVPIEKQIDTSEFFDDETEKEEFMILPNQDLPELEDQSQNFDEFEFDTYGIDQIAATEPKPLVELETEEVPVFEVPTDNSISVDDGSLEVVELNGNAVIGNGMTDDSGIDPSILAELGIDENELLDLSKQAEDGQSVIENASIGEDAQDSVISPDQIERAIPIQYADITNIDVTKIVVFKNKKFTDLSMDIYVGDGVNGATNNKTVSALKEGDIIKYKGFKFKVTSINKKEVELQDMQNDRIYIATPSVNSI